MSAAPFAFIVSPCANIAPHPVSATVPACYMAGVGHRRQRKTPTTILPDPDRVADDGYFIVTVRSPGGGTYRSVVARRELDGYRTEASRLGFELLELAAYESRGGILPMCYWPSGILLFEKATRRILVAERARLRAARSALLS